MTPLNVDSDILEAGKKCITQGGPHGMANLHTPARRVVGIKQNVQEIDLWQEREAKASERCLCDRWVKGCRLRSPPRVGRYL